jgi:lipopolysaccharide/colanic/teichoic acid biosynthesis glycosyltransferase
MNTHRRESIRRARQSAARRRWIDSIFRRRSKPNDGLLLDDADFRYAADCERMRVDRNGSVVSLLLIDLPIQQRSDSPVEVMANLLDRRLRVTDTPGILADGRIGVLLPDTDQEGAWKLAADISAFYPPGPGRPQCEVLVYPDRQKRRSAANAESNGESFESDASQPEQADVTGPTIGGFLFYQATPIWKRLLDVTGGVVGLAVGGPLILFGAAAIKMTSPGPIFFVQEREGKAGRRFKILKLRTMRIDAEQLKPELRSQSHQDGPAFKMPRDPRTTSVGRILRGLSIDELPQFWNVIKGEMSLVGPRPLPVDESLSCQGWQRRRLTVNPGMTGVWQVYGRGRVTFDEWVRMDLQYVATPSLRHDLKLLAATVPSIVFNRGMR